MKKPFLRFLALFLCVVSLSAAAAFPSSAALKQYNDSDLTEIAKLPESSGCYSSQGMAVGEKYIYAAQIGGDNSIATVTRVDRESGKTVKMRDAATGRLTDKNTLKDSSTKFHARRESNKSFFSFCSLEIRAVVSSIIWSYLWSFSISLFISNTLTPCSSAI